MRLQQRLDPHAQVSVAVTVIGEESCAFIGLEVERLMKQALDFVPISVVHSGLTINVRSIH